MFIRSYEEEYVAKYTLPELSYDYGALEPHISGRIMELHHSKHHNTYVNGANTALEKLEAAREAGDFSTINQLTKDLAFNLGGHTNHSIFWRNPSPEAAAKPPVELPPPIMETSGSSVTSPPQSPPQARATKAPASPTRASHPTAAT